MGKTALSGSGSAGHMGGTEASEVNKDGRGAIVQTFKEVMAHNGSHTGFMVWLIKIFSEKRLLRFWLHDLIFSSAPCPRSQSLSFRRVKFESPFLVPLLKNLFVFRFSSI